MSHVQFTTIKMGCLPLKVPSYVWNSESLISEKGGQKQTSHFWEVTVDEKLENLMFKNAVFLMTDILMLLPSQLALEGESC